MKGRHVFIVYRAAARYRDHIRPALPQHGAHRGRGATRPEHEGLSAFRREACRLQQLFKAVSIGVVAEDSAVCPAQQRVHAADGAGRAGELVAERNHRFLVGDGDIQPVPAAAADKVLHLIRGLLRQQIFIVSQLRMDPGGIAVAQFFPKQSAVQHQITSL